MRSSLFLALCAASVSAAHAALPTIEPLLGLPAGSPAEIATSLMDVCSGESPAEPVYSRSAELLGQVYVWHVHPTSEGRYCATLQSPEMAALTPEDYAVLESAANGSPVPPDFVGQVWLRACDTLISTPSNPASYGVRVRADLAAVPPSLASVGEYCISVGDYLLHARRRLTPSAAMHYLQTFGGRPGAIGQRSLTFSPGGIVPPPRTERCEPYCLPMTITGGWIPSGSPPVFTYADSPVAPLLGGAAIGYPDTLPNSAAFAIGVRDTTLAGGVARATGFAPLHFSTVSTSNTPVLPYVELTSPNALQVVDPLDPPVTVSAAQFGGSGTLQFLLNGTPFTSAALPNSLLLPGENIVTVRRSSDGAAASNRIRSLVTTGTFLPNNSAVVVQLAESQSVHTVNPTWSIQNPPPAPLDGVELWRRAGDGSYTMVANNAVQTTSFQELVPMNTTYHYQLRKTRSDRVLAERSFRGENAPPRVLTFTPGPNSLDVSVLAEFQVVFDQQVITSPNWFGLQCGSMTPITVTSGSGASRTVRVQLERPIPPGATCTATINASAVRDLVDQNMPDDISWTFTASGCSYQGWTSVVGDPKVGEPDDAHPVLRYSGRCGIQTDAPGNYLIDSTPTRESRFNSRFYYYTGNRSGSADIFQARDSLGTNIIRVRHIGGNLVFDVRGSNETRMVAVAHLRWYMVQLQWATGVGDGSLAITVKGAGSPAALPVQPFSMLVNATDVIDTVRLGFIAGATTSVPGAPPVHFDGYAWDPQALPARLCRGDASGDTVIGSADRVLVTNEILGTSLAPGQPDVDEDGVVSSTDRVLLTNIILASQGCADL